MGNDDFNYEEIKDCSNMEDFIDCVHNVEALKRFSYDNRNIISWYPFEENSHVLVVNSNRVMTIKYLCDVVDNVTIVNSSTKFCNIIEKMCKNVNIICSDISSVENLEKFDYVLVENIDVNVLDFIFGLLKDNGKVLYAFSNTLGLDKLVSDYSDNSFFKKDIEEIVENNKMNVKFYYMFPNHYIPEVIFTDEYLSINKDVSYVPMYFDGGIVSKRESKVFRDILANGSIYDFANSYLAIIGKENIETDILFVKYNNYRKKEYNLVTYYKNNNYYKKANFKGALGFMDEIVNNHEKLNDMNVRIIDCIKEGNEIYSPIINGENLYDVIKKECYGDVKKTLKYLKEFWDEVKVNYNKFIDLSSNDIFSKYGIFIEEEKHDKLHYVEKLYIDMIPQNVIVKKNKHYFFDQEWRMKKAPIEFLLYRIIRYTMPELNLDGYSVKDFLDKFDLGEYNDEFEKLEDLFVESTRNSWYKYYLDYQKYDSIKLVSENLNFREEQVKELSDSISKLENDVNNLNVELRNMVNSKSWKITKPLRMLNRNK